jgi:4-amino-4-deoxy-L-arabinose transferase-like glycosyltransferase
MPTVHSLTSRIRPLGRGGRRLSGHPDAAAVTIILACGLLARAVVFGAPVFIMKDSQSYFLPGWDLAHGLPFDLEQRRTPVYSWFVALVLTTLGDDLSRIALVQHLLGLGTALAVHWIGRLVFGRGIGFAAGLLTALSGPLLVFEHYVMPEALFAFLLAVGVGALLRGMTTGRLRWYALGGVILGVAALTRPAAQLVLLGLPLVLLARRRSLRATIGPSLVALAGLAAVTMPWIAAVYADYGILSTGATVGEPLLFRTVHQDRGFRLPDRDLDPFGDPSRNEARRMVIDMSARRANPSAIVHQVRRDLKLSRSEADAALRDVALEMIRDQPGYYLLSTARLTAVLFAGRHEALNLSWTTRRDRAGDDTLENWQSVRRIRHLIQPASPEQRAAYGRVERVVELFQPSRFSAFIGVLFLIGTLACVLRPEWRPGLLLSLTAAALILTCTLFSGAVWRFRYPADPFIQTVALAGAVAAFRATRPVAGRLRSQLSERRRRAVAAPQARLRPS